MSASVRRRRRTVEERIGAQLRHGKPGDLAGRGEPLKRDRGAIVSRAGGPLGGGPGTVIEHLTAYATAGQTIAAGSGQLMFDRAAGPPTERRGFRTFSARLAADGEVGAIPLNLTGVYDLKLLGLWASYRDGGDITVTLIRDFAVRGVWTVEGGPITSRLFKEEILGQIEARAGDTLAVTLPNGSGAGQVLTWAQLQLRGIGVAENTSPVGGTPMWVTSGTTIVRVDSSDGSLIRTAFTLPGTTPQGLAMDADLKLWHVDSAAGRVYRLDPSDGEVLASYVSPAGDPQGVAVDPASGDIFHADGDGTIYRLDPDDGSTVSSFAVPGGMGRPSDVTFDTDGDLWIAGTTIHRVNPSTGTSLQSFAAPSGFTQGMDYHAGRLWLAVSPGADFYTLDPSDGTATLEFTFDGGGGLTFDWEG